MKQLTQRTAPNSAPSAPRTQRTARAQRTQRTARAQRTQRTAPREHPGESDVLCLYNSRGRQFTVLY